MRYEDERDYIMRMIKEVAQVLFSLMLGKQYTQVEMAQENKFSVSGTTLDDLNAMVDHGEINKAENILLENLDYEDKEEVAAAILFYEYVSEKKESFLKEHDYSLQEALDGLKQIAEKSGYGDLILEILSEKG